MEHDVKGKKWAYYIVIIGDRDWYVVYAGYQIVKAQSVSQAVDLALRKASGRPEACVVFGPFEEKPQAALG